MYFWFFTFTSLYSREEVIEVLEQLYEDLDITSYMAYELLGAYDMVARLYLEPSREDEFSLALEDRLGPLGLTMQQPFQVDSVVRNWVWAPNADGTGPVRVPDDEALERDFSLAELALLNRHEDVSPERRELVRRYGEKSFVTEANRSYGIKFVLLVGSVYNPTAATLTRVTKKLAKTIDAAKDLLVERSIYTGRGGQRELFLIMCRIDHERFHELRDGLLEPIGDAVAAITGARTTTFPVVSQEFLCFRDQLALEDPERPNVHALLEGNESSLFEIKGSLFTPLDPWLKQGKPREEVATFPLKGVLKAIVGLLNSGGGTLVIGAVEEPRYEESPEAIERLSEYPKVGKHRIIGIVDETYPEWGWDAWEKRLRGLISAKIDQNPGVLVDIRPETIEGQEICVVEIFDPGEEPQFYLQIAADKSVFYARQGTDVVPLHGTRISEHRQQVAQQRRSKKNPKRKHKRG